MPDPPNHRIVLATLLGCLVTVSSSSLVICRADWPVGETVPVYQELSNPVHPALPEGAVLVESSASSGDGTDVTRSLLAEIERARAELNVLRLPDLESDQADVLDKMSELESYLQRTTDADNFAAWMRYLKLDPLREAIDEEASIAARGRASLDLESRLRGVEAGLELPPMVRLRESVQRYIAGLRYSDPKRGIASVERQLDGLVNLLAPESSDGKQEGTKKSRAKKDAEDTEQPTRQPRPLSELSAEDVSQMDLIIGGLTDANQASELVAKIRAHFSEPNLRGWIDGRAITDAVTRPVNNTADVNDCILGTRVIGDSWVDGTLCGQLLPSQGYVLLLLRMDGLFTTSARGFRKPITLDTTGSGDVYAARQLAITEKGVVLGETVATAGLTTQIQRINHPLKLVRRIASQKAAEQRPLAEAISREKLRARVLQQFDEQTAAAAASRRFPSLDAAIDPWLRRLDLPALTRTIGSTTEAVYAVANLQRPDGLAASGPPPPLATILTPSGSGVSPGGYLAAVQMHQSVLDNTISPLLAGETFTPSKIEQLASALGLELPPRPNSNASEPAARAGQNDGDQSDEGEEEEEEDEGQKQESFEVDLESFRPVFMEAGNQELRIGMRGTRFSQGDRELKRTLEVSATYRPVSTDDGTMWLLRDEEVKLSFPGTRRLTVSQTAIKTNMERSFNELFPEELLRRSFPIPPTVKMPALAGKVLQVSAIDLTNGWITIVVR